jgi:hypothetical protein
MTPPDFFDAKFINKEVQKAIKQETKNLANMNPTLPNISLRTTEPKPKPILTPLGNSDFRLRIDNSSMDIIKSCPREASYYILERRGRATSPAMNMGSAIHKALEYFYLHGRTPENLTTCYSLIEQHYQTYPIVDEWRTPEFAKSVILKYYERHPTEPFKILETPSGNPFVEVPFEIELGKVKVNAELPYTHEHLTGQCEPHFDPVEAQSTFINTLHISIIGKIDLGVNQLDGIWAFDHKTASRLGDTFWSKWPLSAQMKTYCWALWKIYKTLPLGAILNVLVVRQPTRTGTPIDFQRQAFTYSEDLLREWEANTLLSVSNFIAMAIQNKFPPNDANCIRIYGKCPYYEVCALPPANRLPFLHTSEFAPVVWDPTEEK